VRTAEQKREFIELKVKILKSFILNLLTELLENPVQFGLCLKLVDGEMLPRIRASFNKNI
jgi:hypothetical protein